LVENGVEGVLELERQLKIEPVHDHADGYFGSAIDGVVNGLDRSVVLGFELALIVVDVVCQFEIELYELAAVLVGLRLQEILALQLVPSPLFDYPTFIRVEVPLDSE
jgi:hypothetical protein